MGLIRNTEEDILKLDIINFLNSFSKTLWDKSLGEFSCIPNSIYNHKNYFFSQCENEALTGTKT